MSLLQIIVLSVSKQDVPDECVKSAHSFYPVSFFKRIAKSTVSSQYVTCKTNSSACWNL